MSFIAWKQLGKTHLHRGKHSIFYRKRGSGETLVLLHGFPTASWDYHKIWGELATRYHLIAPDYIGFGYSDKPFRYQYNMADQADLVENILKENGIERCHLLAHDYGATVAQELLARHNGREALGSNELQLQSICFLNSGLFPETHRPLPIQKALISPFGIFLTPFLNKKKLYKNFHNIFGPDTPPTDEEIDEFYSLLSHNRGKFIFHKLIRYMTERRRYRERWVGAIQNTSVPLRLINGALDPISGRHVAELYAKTIPDPDIVSLDTIGHYPQTEAPEAVLDHYLDFRAKIEG